MKIIKTDKLRLSKLKFKKKIKKKFLIKMFPRVRKYSKNYVLCRMKHLLNFDFMGAYIYF